MADFVAVLRKTIDALGENTPAMREKVFDKARAAIEAKLAALQPPPPPAVGDRQRKALEDAIVLVRKEYDEPPARGHVDDDLEEIFASLAAPRPTSSTPPAPLARPVAADVPAQKELHAAASEPTRTDPDRDGGDETMPPSAVAGSDASADGREPLALPADSRPVRNRGRGRRVTLIAAAAVFLLLLAGGGYALWLNKDDVSAMLGYGSSQQAAQVDPQRDQPAAASAEEDGAADADTATAPEDEPAEEAIVEQAAVAPEPEPEAEPRPEGAARTAAPEKFTQRLLEDGSEVDAGPAGGERRIGEGTSMASAARPAEGSSNGPSSQPRNQPNEQVAVGQRAIFYEERTNSAEGSAEVGSIVWSVVRESPGGDEPPEPAIRAEATIPAHNLQLRMTIRRNADRTLPASHIVEMIFLTPDNFAGGAIDNVLRIAMKDTEQSAGVPLMGIPAKIADGFFLIALSDSPSETNANLNVMSRQSWIDVPVIYRSGRRALMTMEKGLPGERVFNEAIQAWREASSSG